MKELPEQQAKSSCTLALLWGNLPRLRGRAKSIQTALKAGLSCFTESLDLLCDTQIHDLKIASWLNDWAVNGPSASYTLQDKSNGSLSGLYPTQIHIYRDILQGITRFSVLAARLTTLKILSRVASMLTFQAASESAALTFLKDKELAETSIKHCVDDICSSIPFFMRPVDTLTTLQFYPHEPGLAPLFMERTPEMIAGFSNITLCVSVASRLETIPLEQRQWLQQYLTLLSADPLAHQEKAMRLQIKIQQCGKQFI